MSGADTPLISSPWADRDGELEDELQGLEDEEDIPLKSSQGDPPSLYVCLLVLSAGISGLLFGYDTGVISSTLVSIDTSLSNRALTSLDKSVITSSTSLFALLASPASSILADSLGRKRVILLADALFILGALLQAWSTTVAALVVGRSVVGLGVGAASLVVPLYIAETSPAAYRGRLVTVNILFVTLGQVAAYLVGWLFAEHGDRATGWRWMVGLGALPAAAQVLLLLPLPETPRWLVKAGRSAEALVVIQKVAGSGGEQRKKTTGAAASESHRRRTADRVLKEIEVEVRDEAESRRRLRARRQHAGHSSRPLWLDTWEELFSVRRNRRALTIACLLQGLQQLCGFNSLMYYSATIFTLVGFAVPTLTSLTVAVTNFIFTIFALLLVDRMGRRRTLLYSIPFMVVGLLLAALGFSSITLAPSSVGTTTTTPTTTTTTTTTTDPTVASDRSAAVVILISIMIYVASYAIGLGNIPWMQSELFSLSVRSVGSGVSTGTNWLANFVIGLTFLPLMDALGPSWTFVLYGAVCAAGLSLVWRIYPETSGLSLEEAASLLEGDGWGVR